MILGMRKLEDKRQDRVTARCSVLLLESGGVPPSRLLQTLCFFLLGPFVHYGGSDA